MPRVAVKSLAPTRLTALRFSGAVPVLVTRNPLVTARPILTVLMSSTLALDVISDAVAVPVTSGCGASTASLTKVSIVLFGPVGACATKVIEIRHDKPGPTARLQVPTPAEKSASPASRTPVMWSEASPLFVIVNSFVAVCPTRRLPIVNGAELIRGAVPTPLSATSGTGPKPLLGNRSVAVRTPVAVGAKRTRTVQLILDEGGKERATRRLTYGSRIFVDDGDKVKHGQFLSGVGRGAGQGRQR